MWVRPPPGAVGASGLPNAGRQYLDCRSALVQSFGYDSYGYIGGNWAISHNTIPNVCNDEGDIYERERYSSPNQDFRSLFNCPPGVYQVDILEAETFMNGPNQRRCP